MSRIAFAAVLASALVLPTAVSAHAGEAANEITAIGDAHRPGWLKTVGPDEQGRITTRITLSDLDLTTPSGRAAMSSRIRLGTSLLCDRVADQVDAREYSASIHLACWHDTWSQARSQMGNARAVAGSGRKLSVLELGSH